MILLRSIIAFVIVFIVTPAQSQIQTQTNTVERVIDGDTIKLTNGETVRLIGIDAPETSNNKWAKEWSERTGHDIETILELGKISKNFVQKARKLEGRDVCLELDVQERDKYGRLLAYVFYDKKFLSEPTSPKGKNLMEHFYPRYDRCGKELVLLNAEILSVGRAQLMTIPPNVKYIELFELKNQEAKKFKRGIWKECGDDLWECPDGSFVGRIYPRCAFQSCRE